MANQIPVFSIIIPTYNRAPLIEKTLKCLEEQTFQDFETIVVDNCSSDNIKEVIAPFVESGKVRFIQHNKNYERAKSRNTGLENAHGKYATLLDSDDVLFPAFFERANDFIAKNNNVKVFHSLYNILDENGDVYYKIQFPEITSDMSHLVEGNYLSCHAVFLEREVYQAFRFDTNPELTGHEDYEFWLRVLAHYPLQRLPEYNSAMIEHKGRSFSGFTIGQTLKQRAYVIEKFSNDAFLKNRYGKQLNRLNASFFVYAAVQCNLGELYSKALWCLKQAVKIDTSILFTKRFIRSLQIALFKERIK